ncbi:uncharacterized protein [Periplaneta americana]|uniref:uncharacterized protein n=1 Tax=Periplaneta americana TaxID=6978 RepID=UPI0037E751EA
MASSAIILLCLVAGTFFSGVLANFLCTKKGIAVDYFSQCKDEPNTAILMKDFLVIQVNKDEYAFNGDIEFTKNIGERWELKFRLKKCKSKENTKSCEDFFKFDVDKVCEKLPKKGQIWSGFVEKMELNTKCPIKPKNYPINDIKIGPECLKYFPIGPAYYMLKIEGYMNKTKIICADTAFTITCNK